MGSKASAGRVELTPTDTPRTGEEETVLSGKWQGSGSNGKVTKEQISVATKPGVAPRCWQWVLTII